MQYIINFIINILISKLKSLKITKQGEVVNEAAWRAKMARREHKRRLKDALATAIVNKVIDMEVQ